MNTKDFTFKVSAGGRVNIIGEHIDYCGGKVFPAALSLKNTVYVRPNGTNYIRIAWSTLDEEVCLDIDKLGEYEHLKYGNYQAGSAYLWQKAGHKIIGCDMYHDCTVPFGSGLSSSAAIEVSTIAALATLAGEPLDKKEIALVAQQAEREYAHVNCGIMDQYASANGKRGYAILLDCSEVSHTLVPLELGEYSLVITNCNKPHNLVESKYNERRAEVEAALEKLQTRLPAACLADISVQDFEKHADVLQGKLYDRAKHVVYECDRVHRAVNAMQAGNIVELGSILNQSHASLRDLYEVTGKELDTLAQGAQTYPFCIGSRMTGAGFGGCTISLVRRDKVEEFKKHVGTYYEDIIGYAPSFYDADIADGIIVEKLS